MSNDGLLAKSQKKGEQWRDSMLLYVHLKDVFTAADRVLTATGDAQLLALGLAPDLYRDRFRRCVLLAAAIHDLGKANSHFDEMIRGKRDVRVNPQGLRHEWVTILLMKDLREWLLSAVGGSATDLAIVEWAIAGHHPAHDHASPPRLCPPGAGADIRLLTDHKDIPRIVDWLKNELVNIDANFHFGDRKRNLVGTDNVFAQLAVWSKSARQLWDKVQRDDKEKRFVAAVKNCLIAADVAGSALPRVNPNNQNRWEWITQSFEDRPNADDLQMVIAARSESFTERNEDRERFQANVAASSAKVTFVKAGCGSGKTLAAYMWARDQCPGRRLYFCYPTTGTSTEGFKDYLFPPESDPETGIKNALAEKVRAIKAGLFHSRREVDFEIILTAGDDSKSPEADAAARLDSLEAWSTPIVACTVDTVLGLVQNNKRGLFAWPALAQSAFVFDEIHAYDDRLFGALLRYLRDLPGLPSLLMTASLPKPREEALRKTLLDFRGISLDPIPGPTSLETLPRYHKQTVANNDPLSLVEATVQGGDKVLWVCNTVKRVMTAAEQAERMGLSPLIYHSRFRYVDRVQRHKAVIDAFKGEGAALAICSQVAEMSLDLSADLLVTDKATVPALIQRLGRLNRRATNGDKTKPFVVIEPKDHLPYTADDLEAAQRWLDLLPAVNIEQKHLSELWEQSSDNPPEVVPSAWLDGGPTTTVKELRESSPGITVLLKEDHEALLRYEARIREVWENAREERRRVKADDLRPRSDEVHRISAVLLPMPPPPSRFNWRAWHKYKGISVAEQNAISYCPLRGAEWSA